MPIAPPAITVTKDTLASRLGKTGPADAAEVERCFNLAKDTLLDAVRNAWRAVPGNDADECVLRIGQSIWDMRKTSNGQGQVSVEGAPSPRTPTDPLVTSRPIIRKYVVMGL